MSDQDFQTLLQFFKALADATRLRILGILATRECSVEELAALLNLRAPTISHHLAKLKELRLVGMRPEGNTHIYWLNEEKLSGMKKEMLTAERLASLVAPASGDAWERKVLADFFEGVRLKEIPASRKKRLVILKWLAGQFEMGRPYPEAEVNEVIKRHHPDFATLRRELVANRLMQREDGVYWRLDHAESGPFSSRPSSSLRSLRSSRLGPAPATRETMDVNAP